MYHLTLSSGERRAIDFVGNRYPSGDQLRDVLMDCIPSDADWSEDGDITFNIPEHMAWEINDLYEEESEGGHSGYPMFDDELMEKMHEFIDHIV